MTVFVFLGPTLPARDALRHLDAVYLPPVAEGDVHRVLRRCPSAIGIVDGRFQDVPAVWHKEILWAISRGVPVYGAASMGALRAAELAVFGMRGIGGVFAAYRDGELEDDDEVAVAHGGPEDGYRATSEAMVNIRRTLSAAADAGVLAAPTVRRLVALAKDAFYPHRGYPALLRHGAGAGLPAGELDALAAWLPGNRIDQKRDDAVAMLGAIRDDLAAGRAPEPVSFVFQHTQFFETARRSAGELVHAGEPALEAEPSVAARPGNGGPGAEPGGGAAGNGGPGGGAANRSGAPGLDRVTLEDLIDELRLDLPRYRLTRQRALARCLAARQSAMAGADDDLTDDELTAEADRFRRDRGLYGAEQTERWLAGNDLSLEQFAGLIREEAVARRGAEEVAGELDLYLRSQLRVDGGYPDLVARLRVKRRMLAEYGLDDASADLDDVSYEDLLRWFFGERGIAVPRDIVDFWRGLGFPDEVTFLSTVRREYWFSTLSQRETGSTT